MSTPEQWSDKLATGASDSSAIARGFKPALEKERKVSSLTHVIQWMQARIAALRSGIERGAAAVEYGLLVALIAVAIIGAVIALGGKVKGTFTCVANSLPQTSTSTATSAAC